MPLAADSFSSRFEPWPAPQCDLQNNNLRMLTLAAYLPFLSQRLSLPFLSHTSRQHISLPSLIFLTSSLSFFFYLTHITSFCLSLVHYTSLPSPSHNASLFFSLSNCQTMSQHLSLSSSDSQKRSLSLPPSFSRTHSSTSHHLSSTVE